MDRKYRIILINSKYKDILEKSIELEKKNGYVVLKRYQNETGKYYCEMELSVDE